MPVEVKSTNASFGGKLMKLAHNSSTVGCEMKFNLYLPPQAYAGKKVPVIMFLSGMTCTEDNCAEKGFFQHAASKQGIAVLYPDTSPRGKDIPDSEDGVWQFAQGSGYYVNATKEPWSKNFRMYDYVTKELPELVNEEFGDKIDISRISVTGNSMGGHGAMNLFLKNPGKYKSVSALCPISNPLNCGWGETAFSGYFGDNWKEDGKQYDSCELIKAWKGEPLDILVDCGTDDPFYKKGELLPENLVKAAKEAGQPESAVTLRLHEGYTHSFFFVASFADDHVNHAAKYLFA